MPGSEKRVAATRAGYWMLKTPCSSPSLTAPGDAHFVPIDSGRNLISGIAPVTAVPYLLSSRAVPPPGIAPCSDGASHLEASIIMLIRI